MEIRWLGEVCSALPSSGGRGHSCDHQAMPLIEVHSQGGNWGSVSGQCRRKRLNWGYRLGNIWTLASSRVVNSKDTRSLTLSPFLYPSLLSETRVSTIPSSHATGRDP